MDTESSTNRSRIFDRNVRKAVSLWKTDFANSKTDCVMKLAGVYDQVEAAVGKVLEAENINLKNKEPIFGNVLPGTEEKILTAEYALILQCRQ